MWRALAILAVSCSGEPNRPTPKPVEPTAPGSAAAPAPAPLFVPDAMVADAQAAAITKPADKPRPGSTRVEVDAHDLVSFQLASKAIVDVEPPFRKPTLEDRGSPAASLRFDAPKLRPIRIYRPAFTTSVEETLATNRLAAARSRREGDCLLTENVEGHSVLVDCYSQAPAGPVVCNWEGDPRQTDKIVRICGSLGYE